MLHKNLVEKKSGFRALDDAELEAVSGGDIVVTAPRPDPWTISVDPSDLASVGMTIDDLFRDTPPNPFGDGAVRDGGGATSDPVYGPPEDDDSDDDEGNGDEYRIPEELRESPDGQPDPDTSPVDVSNDSVVPAPIVDTSQPRTNLPGAEVGDGIIVNPIILGPITDPNGGGGRVTVPLG